MGKFTKYGGVANWSHTMKEFENHVLVIKNMTPCKTQYGPSFVMHCDVMLDGDEVELDTTVLLIGKIAFDQMSKYLEEVTGNDNPYPVSVLVSRVVRSGASDYWLLEDPDEPAE